MKVNKQQIEDLDLSESERWLAREKRIVRWLYRAVYTMSGMAVLIPLGTMLAVGPCAPVPKTLAVLMAERIESAKQQGLVVAPHVERALLAALMFKTIEDPDWGYVSPKAPVTRWCKSVE